MAKKKVAKKKDVKKSTTDADTALRRYEILISYLQYENSTFWTTSGFFLIGHIALFGFFAQIVASIEDKGSKETTITLAYGMCIFGVILFIIWFRAIMVSFFWITRWQNIIKNKLEKDAFGDDIEVIRNIPSHGWRWFIFWWPGAIRIQFLVVILWGVVWVCSYFYLRWFLV